MTVLVTGAGGQLGKEIKKASSSYKDFHFIFTKKQDLDITCFTQLRDYISKKEISFVINCAAFTAVEQAEKSYEIADKVNREGVINLVKVLEETNGKLIHISTDYVFDGQSSVPYRESDLVNPLSVYGKTKRGGEIAVIDSDIDAIVIRTSWLYSSCGVNFVTKMIELGASESGLRLVYDQVGTPTNARDLACICLKILSRGDTKVIGDRGKVYHYSNEGVASWYDFGLAVMELKGLSCNVEPIDSRDFPTLAVRPPFSLMNKSKIKLDFGIKIRHWRSALEECIKKMDRKL